MVFDPTKLGATGEFPDGKLSPDDEGAVNLAVGVDRDLNVRIDFGTPVAWLAMSPEQAKEFGELVVAHANWAMDHRPKEGGDADTAVD